MPVHSATAHHHRDQCTCSERRNSPTSDESRPLGISSVLPGVWRREWRVHFEASRCSEWFGVAWRRRLEQLGPRPALRLPSFPAIPAACITASCSHAANTARRQTLKSRSQRRRRRRSPAQRGTRKMPLDQHSPCVTPVVAMDTSSADASTAVPRREIEDTENDEVL